MTCSTGLKIAKVTANAMYASLDLHQRIVPAVLKDANGNILKESKIEKESESILEFLDGTNAAVVMESGYKQPSIHI